MRFTKKTAAAAPVNFDDVQKNVSSTIKETYAGEEVQGRTRKRIAVELIEEKKLAGEFITKAALKDVVGSHNRPRELDQFLSLDYVGNIHESTAFAGKNDAILADLLRWISPDTYDMFMPGFEYYQAKRDVFAVYNHRAYELEIITTVDQWCASFDRSVWLADDPINKHSFLRAGKDVCNYFIMVLPEGFIDVRLIPEYIGVLWIKKPEKGYYTFEAATLPPPNQARFLEKSSYRLILKQFATYYQQLLHEQRALTAEKAAAAQKGKKATVPKTTPAKKKGAALAAKNRGAGHAGSATVSKRRSGTGLPDKGAEKATPTGKKHVSGKVPVRKSKKVSGAAKRK